MKHLWIRGAIAVSLSLTFGSIFWPDQTSYAPELAAPISDGETGPINGGVVRQMSSDNIDPHTSANGPLSEVAMAAADLQRTKFEIDELLEQIHDASQLGNEHLSAYTIEQLQEKIFQESISHPDSLAQVLEYFRSNTNTETANYLATVLGEIRDPLVEAAALRMVTDSADSMQRIAGLNLLARLNIDNPETKLTLVNILERETDSEVLGNALYALRYHVTNPEVVRPVNQTLTRLTTHKNPEVRRRAMVSLAEWSAGKQEVSTLIYGLKDPSPDVRAGAAYALSHVRDKSTIAMHALALSVSDENEDWQVRTISWRALKRYSLDEKAFSIYEKFRLHKESLDEASDIDDDDDPP